MRLTVMLSKLIEINSKKTHIAIGLMSGTSADGVDASLCELSGEGRGGLKLNILAEHTEPFPDFVRDRVLKACATGGGNSAEICELNFVLAEVFAQAALGLLNSAKTKPVDVDFIGCHGQTVSHIPPRTDSHTIELGSTLQLGEAAVLAERTGILVVSNFRPRDIAAGGQGAPLVPFVDYLLFSRPEKTRVVLNIGGISNVTYLPSDGAISETLAYDTGPGNMIVDALVQFMTQGAESFDRDGIIAASGKIDQTLLNEMLKHPFLKRAPPKSTGREEFGAEFAQKMLDIGTRHGLTTRDVIATATCFTARSIAGSIRKVLSTRRKIDEVIASGGGVFNPVLMAHLEKELNGIPLTTSGQYGLPVKAKESVAFAILARESVLGRPGNLPSATGAKGPRVLGQFTPP